MNVLIISCMYPSPANQVSGIFVHEQVRTLREKKVDVRVVSPVPWTPFPINHFRKKWRQLSLIPKQKLLENVPIWYPRYLAFPYAWFFATSGVRIYHGIKRLARDLYQESPFDLIHAHVALPDGYAGSLIASEFGVPLIITIHGQDLQQTVNRGGGCQSALAFAFNYASRVILVSNKLKHLAERHFSCHDKLVVIPNGVDPTKINVRQPRGSNNYTKKITILSVSSLIATKGIDLNIVALERLSKKYPSLRYQVIGDGPLKRDLQLMVARLKLEDRVEFLGYQPHHIVMKYMSECDIFTLPSFPEGFGVVYLEAMASEKPVIGCQGEGIEDFVVHGKTGLLIKPRDVVSLVEALDYLLSNPEKAKAIGEQARKVVMEKYTWEKNAEKTLLVYKEVLNEAMQS